MQGTSISRARLVFGLLGLALILGLSRTVLAQPAWYTPGVGGFDPNVPKFYQHQDVMGGRRRGSQRMGTGRWMVRLGCVR